MKPVGWRNIFFTVVLLYFVGLAMGNQTLQMVFKPLLLLSLFAFFLSHKPPNDPFLRRWMATALLASMAGDSLLLFARHQEWFFMLGLLAFLWAHISYIICLHTIRKKAGLEGRWYLAIIVGVYYFFIMGFLMPHLGFLKIPVLVYGVVMSGMLFLALLLIDLPNAKTGRYFATGAVLFVASDSLLAINKFHHPVPWASWAIMIPYIWGQWLLTIGMLRQLAKSKSQEPEAFHLEK